MTIKCAVYCTFLFLLAGCSSDSVKEEQHKSTESSSPDPNTTSPEEAAAFHNTDAGHTGNQMIEDSSTPPFEHDCPCEWKKFGEQRIGNHRHIYICGKNFDPRLPSCSFTWGEEINNEIPNDSTVTIQSIHLMDLDEFKIPGNGTVYGDDFTRRSVIMVHTYDIVTGKSKTEYDPGASGNYIFPSGWN